MSAKEVSTIQVQPADKAKIRKIWMTCLILGVITAIEFVFAYQMGAGALRTSIFIVMTILKAFYIVSEFMHLKYEAKALIWSIILPMVFVVWMLVAFANEGNAVLDARSF